MTNGVLLLVILIEIGGQRSENAERRTSNAELPRFNDLTFQRGEAKRRQRTESREQKGGAVRTSVTLLGQNIGNTMSIIGYAFSVSFAVFFVAKSTWPSRRRPNQTSIKSSAIGLRPTDHPPKLVLRKSD